jgi:hypothetical protein
MLAHPETQGYVASATGAVDWSMVVARRASLSAWLRFMAREPDDAELAAWLMKTGRAHGRRGKGTGRIRARYIVAIVSVARDCVNDILMKNVGRDDDHRATRAWGRMLMVHLDLLLAVMAAGETASWY